jgi:hypothetical protein
LLVIADRRQWTIQTCFLPQGIVISAVNSMGEIRDPEDGKALQNFMICVEMLLAGTAMIYAFPYKQYSIGGSTAGFRLDAFAHAASVSDVVKDVVHVFAPSYSDYVLYSDGGPADHVKRKKFRGQKGTDAPKSSLVKNMAKTGLAGLDNVLEAAGGLAAGRRSKTPAPSASKAARAMERNRWGASGPSGGGERQGSKGDKACAAVGNWRITAMILIFELWIAP